MNATPANSDQPDDDGVIRVNSIREWVDSFDRIIHRIADDVAYDNRLWDLKSADLIEPLRWFANDNFSRSAEELAEMADKLTPGGAHDDGNLVKLVQRCVFAPCPRLVAACLYSAWQGGKVGFQFLPLPDPERITLEEYQEQAGDLTEALQQGDSFNLLVGEDQAFLDSLPDRFIAYRGCSDTTVEMASEGVCWSTSREVARWFAARGTGEPILLSTWVRKADVLLAFASEFEVVISPRKVRQLKAGRFELGKSKRPKMSWTPPEVPADQLAA